MPPSTLIDVSQPGTCRSCAAGIYWRREVSGKPNPYNPPETCPACRGAGVLAATSVPPGEGETCVRCGGQGRIQISHFATCPKAKEHRRREASA